MPFRRPVPALAFMGPCVVALATSACALRTIEDFGEQDSEAATSDDPATSSDPMTSVGTTDPFDPTTSTGDQPQPLLSHAVHIQPIWDAHCTDACHSAGGEWVFLDLANAYESIVGVPSTQNQRSFIEPGNPDGSYLWHKINDTQAEAGGGGLDMPKSRGGEDPTVLLPEDYALIEAWILQGAQP